ncbi:energy-coupled thiamine transporter ThiT [Dorea sp. D27]|uniref:energy-coupled thiamine transporter ThiT n=1 Tax=Dorea sp. D27 TaxID=658665 RepID=UPI0006736928|nr:energy-coupled thiamine transporter ThiT [Dorea sp. D27]KMZ53345.1 putative proton-coupled thiamine transporter YuaJ [Dorea sp. D27]
MSKSSVKTSTSSGVVIKKLVFSAVGIALAMVTSYIKVWDMPMGGSVTLLSMLFICLIGYWYGLKYGLLTGVAYGILQFVVDPYMLSIPQVVLDYPLAFGALGLSGLFSDRKYGLQTGYIVGVLGRFICSLLSGVIFFASYAPDGMNPWAYSALYQGSYLGAEAVITLVIISLPPVTKALKYVKGQTDA